MNRITSLLLCGILLLNVFSRTTIAFSFFLNQKTIASTVCVNKAHPEKHCHGNCFLKKELSKQDKREQHSIVFSKDKPEYLSGNFISLIHFPDAEPVGRLYSTFILMDGNSAGIFHPPCGIPIG